MHKYHHDNKVTYALALICCTFVSTEVVLAKKYTPDWNSIDSRPIPGWYNDAKFGIFMHLTTSVVPGE